MCAIKIGDEVGFVVSDDNGDQRFVPAKILYIDLFPGEVLLDLPGADQLICQLKEEVKMWVDIPEHLRLKK